MAKFHLGGQAVLEGVMMRGEHNWVIAVRTPDQKIVVKDRLIKSPSKRFPILKLFILRGVVALIEALILGIQALSMSVQEATEEDVEITPTEMTFTIIIALLFGIGLFVILPAFATRLVDRYLGNILLLSAVEGLLRITIFILYVYVISKMKDIARFFEYHGAEHKVIHAYEAGENLTPETASKYKAQHVRCGTSFILIVMIIVIFVFALLGRPPLILRIISRLLIIPIIAGISYEIIKLAGKHKDAYWVKILTLPGLLLQKMTTREPSLDQLEVAISSLTRLLALEGVKTREEVEASLP